MSLKMISYRRPEFSFSRILVAKFWKVGSSSILPNWKPWSPPYYLCIFNSISCEFKHKWFYLQYGESKLSPFYRYKRVNFSSPYSIRFSTKACKYFIIRNLQKLLFEPQIQVLEIQEIKLDNYNSVSFLRIWVLFGIKLLAMIILGLFWHVKIIF